MLTTLLLPPYLYELLALDLLLLVACVWLTVKILLRARIRHPNLTEIPISSRPISSQESVVTLAPLLYAAPPLYSAPPEIILPPECESELPAAATSENSYISDAAAYPFASSQQAETIQFRELRSNADLFADPLDGTLFQVGEEILVCRCGVGYHHQTWEWIQEQHDGKCVHCEAKDLIEKRVI